jgi:UDP-N-acetylglucosamine--N-acetylmuramyl-(pentapeptide) pyrophosphoryl-undecaprenol N-acetylglucosamine transferase
VGTNRGLENDLVPRAGYQLKTIEAYGFQKEISLKNFKNIIKTFASQKEMRNFLLEFKPDIVIGTGGYICVPVFGSAMKLGIPTLLHESNAYPGRSVKMYAKKVNRVLVGFKETKESLNNAENVVVTGTPTKVKKMNITYTEKMKILNSIGIKSDLPIVLIFGGSQGAKKINDSVYNLIKNNMNKKYQIIWATGLKQFDVIKSAFKSDNLDIEKLKNVKILPYIYNMDELMNVSDLLICRSGAMTITEISIVGKPAIFIPLPSKMANRQEDNAKVLEKIGAAKIISNELINYQNLAENIDSVIQDRILLSEMGTKALSLAPHNVEEKIYKEIKCITV